MRAMILKKPGQPLELVDLPKPKPKENEILIKVSVCGACHTDLDEAEGRLATKLPVVPGHQAVGTVSELGKGVSKHKVGDRVGVTWLYNSCGQCDFCKKGEENLCEKAKWTGKDANGGYAEYMVINENYAYPIPKRFTDSQAAPLFARCHRLSHFATCGYPKRRNNRPVWFRGICTYRHSNHKTQIPR